MSCDSQASGPLRSASPAALERAQTGARARGQWTHRQAEAEHAASTYDSHYTEQVRAASPPPPPSELRPRWRLPPGLVELNSRSSPFLEL
eukprot:1909583-Pleurochrysis_carterae.AAC.2